MTEQQDEQGTGGRSLQDSLRASSVRAAGYAYLLGDASLFASGYMSGRGKEAATGLLWGAGGLVCAKYGNPDAEAQLKRLSRRLGTYLEKQGVEIPANPDTEMLAKPGGMIDRAEEFMYKYPSQILNTGYALGAVSLMRSGVQHKKGWDTASGALVLGGALAGLLIREDNPATTAIDEGEPEGMHQKAIHWAKEKPLRIPAIAYTLNDGTLTMSAIKEMRSNPAQKSYLFKFFTVASYLFGNAMLYLSSKENTSTGAAAVPMDKLADASAKVIAAQHPELQEALIDHVSVFLSQQPEVKMKADAISNLLYAKLGQTPKPSSPDLFPARP